MKTETKTWLIRQLKHAAMIIFISIVLAVGMNTFRDGGIPWVEKRKQYQRGERFPYIPLLSTEIPEYRKYLGLPLDREMITIADIQADLLVLGVINVFCFDCQGQALTLNTVHRMIEKRPDLKNRIKILGIAYGNKKKSVDRFKADYDIVFPLIPDPEGRTEKIIKPGVYTPLNMVIGRDDSGGLGTVMGYYKGEVEEPKVMFNALVKLLETDRDSVELDEMFQSENNDMKERP